MTSYLLNRARIAYMTISGSEERRLSLLFVSNYFSIKDCFEHTIFRH